MIDTVVLDIPFHLDFVAHKLTKDGRAIGLVSLEACHERGCKVAAGEIIDWVSPGVAEITSLRSCWDSISSANSSLAFKIYSGSETYYPFVQIKGSVNKILQGHNVYGSDNPEIILSLIQALMLAMPTFSNMLDFSNTLIKQIDCTYTAHVENKNIAQQVIHACKRVHSGQTQCSKNSHETTNYWGKSGKGERTSRNKVLKQYLKYFELQSQIIEVEKKLEKDPSNVYFSRQLVAMKSPEVQIFAENAIRHEACVMPDMMKRLNVPNHLGDFLDYVESYNGNVIETLWKAAWKDIFDAFGGENMKIYKDYEVFNELKKIYVTVTPKGNITYSKAKRLHKFYLDMVTYGWDKVKDTLSESKFYRDVTDLMQVVPKAQLQNLHGSESNVLPIIRMINVDFNAQTPNGWVEPDCLSAQFNKNREHFKLHRVG
jgi:II/X family phage/plasmid replication protein